MWMCFYFFFFQAEDGIRDLYVTGVQTCALPISPRGCRRCSCGQALRVERVPADGAGRAGADFPGHVALVHERVDRVLERSEERRVGKECRSRGAPYPEKKKKERTGGT